MTQINNSLNNFKIPSKLIYHLFCFVTLVAYNQNNVIVVYYLKYAKKLQFQALIYFFPIDSKLLVYVISFCSSYCLKICGVIKTFLSLICREKLSLSIKKVGFTIKIVVFLIRASKTRFSKNSKIANF